MYNGRFYVYIGALIMPKKMVDKNEKKSSLTHEEMEHLKESMSHNHELMKRLAVL
jgi:hypothetical protein